MRKGIHPPTGLVQFRCASCSATWLTTSTKLDGKVEEFEGKEYPAIVLETCSGCHPFYTGSQTFIDTAGRVEKFQKRFAKFIPEDKKEAESKPEKTEEGEKAEESEKAKV